MVGVGGGFADTTFSPFETLNPLSDFTIAKESPSLVECEIVDDSLTYQSTASLSSWSIPTGGLDFNYDFDSSSIPPTSSATEIDEGGSFSRSSATEMLPFENFGGGKLVLGASKTVQTSDNQSLNSTNTSEANSPRTDSAIDHVTSSSGPFICDFQGCRRSYKRIHEVRRHRRVHSSTKPYACTFSNCRRSGQNGFIRKDHLKQHFRQVHRA